ncbi:MAG: NAD-dependent epimerase/dehydratase family protein [Deltaproteobacteria bacterium]|nr:MAG: NAD-dependent epimerase/dehydratase family protein [Deltaproteobacteria bacterium]
MKTPSDRPVERVVVTGGAGFIGRWVVKKLIERGIHTWVVDDLSSGSMRNLAEFKNDRLLEGIRICRVHDAAALERALPEGADAVVHLAARINVQHSIDDPADTFNSDVVGTFNVLEWARRKGAAFTFVSSCMVYAPANGNPITERHPVRPASPYAASKLAAEQLVLSYHRAYGMNNCVLRPFNTYGPYQRSDGEGGVVAVFLRRAMEGLPLYVFGDGSQTRDLVYVEDCAEFIVRAATTPSAAGHVINFGTGRDIPIMDLAKKISFQAGMVPIAKKPHPHPQAEIQRLVCRPELAAELLGIEPRVDLDEGIRRTRHWMERQVAVGPLQEAASGG